MNECLRLCPGHVGIAVELCCRTSGSVEALDALLLLRAVPISAGIIAVEAALQYPGHEPVNRPLVLNSATSGNGRNAFLLAHLRLKITLTLWAGHRLRLLASDLRGLILFDRCIQVLLALMIRSLLHRLLLFAHISSSGIRIEGLVAWHAAIWAEILGRLVVGVSLVSRLFLGVAVD